MAKNKDLVPSGERKVTKRVAKDGSQRGLHKRPKRHDALMADIRAAVERDTGIVDWDPVVMMSIIAARAFCGYPAVDENGNPIIDSETGTQVMVPPDFALATAAAAKVAPYVHSQLRPKDPAEEEKDPQGEAAEKRERILAAFEKMGVEVKRDE
tara:strand:+ start:504 stop:965 length:462 start_codon:yes stop_codon:yes gene_type:complete